MGGYVSKLFNTRLIAVKRTILEDLYTGSMTVYTNEYVTDEKTGKEVYKKNIVCEDEPCRVTRQNAPQPSHGNPKKYDEITQLTCRPELIIPPGSVFEITFNGRTEKYVNSASPRVYSSHQSIFLKTWSDTKNYA